MHAWMYSFEASLTHSSDIKASFLRGPESSMYEFV